MKRMILVLAGTVGLFASLSVVTVSAGGPGPQLNEEAALVLYPLPTADPCVVNGLSVDVIDFVTPNRPDQIYFDLSSSNVCTGETLRSIGIPPVNEPVLLDEAGFSHSHGHDIGDLDVTLPAFDYVTQSGTSVTLDLRWASTRGVSDPSFVVTGSASSSDFAIVLDDSITWNTWGSELGFPWAGMWPCRVSPPTSRPGCIGQ